MKRFSIFRMMPALVLSSLITFILPLARGGIDMGVFSIPTNAEVEVVSNQPQAFKPLDQECHVAVDGSQIRSFLTTRCKVYDPFANDMGSDSGFIEDILAKNGTLTLPKNLSEPILSEIKKLEPGAEDGVKEKRFLGMIIHIEGAMKTSKGEVYFWRLYSDSALLLWTSEGTERLLVKLVR